MKKNLLLIMLAILLCFSFAACGGGDDQGGNSSDPQGEMQPPDLTGEWKQVNSSSDDSYHIATIQDDVIEIFWFDESTDSKSLYWAGSFVIPTTADEPYTWDSENDKEKTDAAMLASGDDTKTFTYSDGQISYETSALGTTQTVKLEKQ